MGPTECTVVVNDHVHAVCAAMLASTEPSQVLDLLEYVSSIYINHQDQQRPIESSHSSEQLAKSHATLHKLLQSGAEVHSIQEAFWQSAFPYLSENLLSGLSNTTVKIVTDSSSCQDIFSRAAALPLLTALTQSLASSQPGWEALHGTKILPSEGAQFAARLLAESFASSEASKLNELLDLYSDTMVDGRDYSQMLQTASLLISLPERAAYVGTESLQNPSFVTTIVRNLLQLVQKAETGNTSSQSQQGHRPLDESGEGAEIFVAAEQSTCEPNGIGNGKEQDGWTGNRGGVASTSASSGYQAPRHSPQQNMMASEPTVQTPVEGRLLFLGTVISKLAVRGHAKQIAGAIWSLHRHAERPGSAPEFMQLALQGQDSVAVEKLGGALLSEAAESGFTKDAALRTLCGAFGSAQILALPGMRYLLQEKLLLHSMTMPSALDLYIHLLASLPTFSMTQIAREIAEVWASQECIDRLSLARQAYLTAALILILKQLGKQSLETAHSLMGSLLKGISRRLDSAIVPIRRQGMRVGGCFSKIIDPSKPLFEEQETLDFLAEEAWHPDCIATEFGIPEFPDTKPPGQRSANPQGREFELEKSQAMNLQSREHAVGSKTANADLLSLEGSDARAEEATIHLSDSATARSRPLIQEEQATESDSDDSLEAYDLEEGDAEEFARDGDRPLQLRDVAEMLRKADEPKTVVKALGMMATLIEAAPDELASYSSEVARSLLFCRPPDWEDLENGPQEQRPSYQRLRAMVSLLVEIPRDAGLALAGEMFSPHLDLHQRLLSLDSLSAAAIQMSTPPSQAKQALLTQDAGGGRQLALDSHKVGTTTRRHVKSLALRNAEKAKTFRNRFPGVVLDWVSALLRDCGGEKQGVELFGRDNLLLGRLLITLGTFVQAASPSMETFQAAATTLELIRMREVHGHAQAYVRRCALIAASTVVAALPPATLAGAMLGGRGSVQQELLVERLEWLRNWLAVLMQTDTDSQVRQLASGCATLQSELANKALESIESGDPALYRSLEKKGPSELLGISGPQNSRGSQFQITLPGI